MGGETAGQMIKLCLCASPLTRMLNAEMIVGTYAALATFSAMNASVPRVQPLVEIK